MAGPRQGAGQLPLRNRRCAGGREGTGPHLAITEVGAPELPAAVIAHGVGSSGRFIVDAFAAPLLAADLRLVTYDLRGHGASDPARQVGDHVLARHVEDLRAVTEDVGARLVGGVSLGAHAAVALAAEQGSERQLEGVLACLPAWLGSAQAGVGPHAAVAAEVRRVGVPAALARAAADPAVPRWLAELLERDWNDADERSLAAALLALDGGEAPAPRELAAVATPIGVVGWPEDPGHPLGVAEAWAELAPNAVLGRTTMGLVGADAAELGRTAVAAWREAEQQRPRRP
jgi:pimeloyl-ACP methyl ester carboxylesterase